MTTLVPEDAWMSNADYARQRLIEQERRDKFICAALQGLLARNTLNATWEAVVKHSVLLADAILKAADE